MRNGKDQSKFSSRRNTCPPFLPSYLPPSNPLLKNKEHEDSRIQSPTPLPNDDPPTRTVSFPSIVLELRTKLGLDLFGVLSGSEFLVCVGEAPV